VPLLSHLHASTSATSHDPDTADASIAAGPSVAGPSVAGPSVAGPSVAGPHVADLSSRALSNTPSPADILALFNEGSDTESEPEPNVAFSRLNLSTDESAEGAEAEDAEAEGADLIFAGSTSDASIATAGNNTPSPTDVLQALMVDGSDADSELDPESISAAQVCQTLLADDSFNDDHPWPSISATDVHHALLAEESSDDDADDSNVLLPSLPSNRPRWTAADFETYPDPDMYITSESDGSS
jgi:hypothetical protein